MTTTVTVVGTLTRTPELRYTTSGQATVNLGVADNRTWTPKGGGERQESTSFYNVTVWGEMAEHCAESLAKGIRVIVTGRLEQRSWETPDGIEKSVVDIVADAIGPDLRWATCTVNRNERSDRSAAPSAPGSGSGGREPAAPASGDYGDEPFMFAVGVETVPSWRDLHRGAH